MWGYKAVTGSWPGDCNADGVIDIGVSGEAKGVSTPNCAFDVRSQEAMTKVFTDLASANMLDDELRAKFADADGQYMQLAHAIGSRKVNEPSEAVKGQNVLVAFDVSIELALWLDKKIDGKLAASEGRVRLWDEKTSQDWPSETNGDSVSIAYYFDSKI